MTAADMDEPGPDGASPRRAEARESDRPGKARAAASFLGVPIEVTVSVGKARPLVSELVELRRDSVLTLDSTVDDPVEIYIGDRLIARGELQEIGDDTGRLGVRLTEVADFSNDL
jgi:flagellar motor switch protein FliN